MNGSAIYPGTFDPLTLGHVDLVSRAAKIFDRVILAVSVSTHKTPLFSLKERLDMAKQMAASFDNVEVDSFGGLLVDYAHRKGATVLIRGLRAFSDFDYEFQMALTNRKIAPDIETLFLMPNETCSYLSSSMVREIAVHQGDISKFVPPFVHTAMKKKIKRPEKAAR